MSELAAQGASDYLAIPLRVYSIGLASLVVVTDRIGGFDEKDMVKFGVLAEAIAPVFELVELRRRSKERTKE